MQRYPSDIAFTPAVKEIQTAKGSRAGYAKVERGRAWKTRVTPDLADYLARLDMFYLGTANAGGQTGNVVAGNRIIRLKDWFVRGYVLKLDR